MMKHVLYLVGLALLMLTSSARCAEDAVQTECDTMVKNPNYEVYRTVMLIMDANPSLMESQDPKKRNQYCMKLRSAYNSYYYRYGTAVSITTPEEQHFVIRTCVLKYNPVTIVKERKRFDYVLGVIKECKIGEVW